MHMVCMYMHMHLHLHMYMCMRTEIEEYIHPRD